MKLKNVTVRNSYVKNGTGRGTRTPKALRPVDFESTASTNSAIPARIGIISQFQRNLSMPNFPDQSRRCTGNRRQDVEGIGLLCGPGLGTAGTAPQFAGVGSVNGRCPGPDRHRAEPGGIGKNLSGAARWLRPTRRTPHRNGG